MITITPAGEQFRSSLVRELEELSSRDQLTSKEKRRFDAVKVLIKQVSNGMSPSDIVGSDVARLEEEVRSFSVRNRIPAEAESEWRDFISGNSKRQFQYTGKHEVRAAAQTAGSQSISYTEGPEGGYFVPAGYVYRQLESMRAYDELFDPYNHNAIETETGAPIALPSFDDVSNASTIVGENTNNGAAPLVTFTNTQLSAYSYRTRPIYISMELEQDSGVPVGSLIERVFAIRHARGVGKDLITGVGGGSAPTGILTALNLLDTPEIIAGGANPNSGNAGDTGANSIGSQDLSSLFFSLDRAYRREASWLMADDTFHHIAQVLDKMGRPLVQYHNSLSEVATIFGRPVVICPSMPKIAPNAPVVVFYVPRYFAVRTATRGMFVQKLSETPGAVEFGAIGFQGWYRVDSALVVPNASYAPAQQLIMHS